MPVLVAGIIESDERTTSINLISQIFSDSDKKLSIIHSSSLVGLDSKKVPGYLRELKKNNVDILLMGIRLEDLTYDVFAGFNFDVIIFINQADDLLKDLNSNYRELMQKLFLLMDEKGTVIVNADDYERISLLQGKKYSVLTYGFNSKASLTASSIGEGIFKENFICCLQRTILTKDGKGIEPQEFSIRINSTGYEAHAVMAVAAFAIFTGISLDYSSPKQQILTVQSGEIFI